MVAEYKMLSGRDESIRMVGIPAVGVRQQEQAAVEMENVHLHSRAVCYQSCNQAVVPLPESQGEHRR